MVRIIPNGLAAAEARAMLLSAPSGDVTSKIGMTLGGSVLTNNALWTEKWSAVDSVTNGQCSLTVKAASAALVRLRVLSH